MEAGANVPAVDDVELVAAMRGGDREAAHEAFGALYDRYAARLYSYAVTLVRDRDTASDVLHDAFLIAHARIGQLRDPARVRSWLYAVVRSEALRVLREGRRSTDLDAAGDVMDGSVDLDAGLGAQEARALVAAAVAGLGPKDREVIELALRHELDNAEIAGSLGVSSSHAAALVSRAKGQFEKSLGTLVLMRTRGRSCDELAGLLAGEGDALTPLLRKRIGRHLSDCEACERERRGAVAALPGIAMAMPFLVAPVSLRERLVATVSIPPAGAVGDRAGRFDADGFPRSAAAPRRRMTLVAVLAGVFVLLLAGAGAVAIGSGEDPAPVSAPIPVAPGSALPTVTASGWSTPTAASASVTGSASTSASTTPPTPSTPTASVTAGGARAQEPTVRPPHRAPAPAPTRAVTPATVTVTWQDLDAAACPATFSGRVSASVGGGPITSVVASWVPINGGSGAGGQVRLTRVSASVWRGTLSGVPAQQENQLRVRVRTSDGAVTTSTAQDFSHICPQ